MRTVFLLLFVAFIGLVGHAQALTGPAATYDRTFWGGIEKIKGLDPKTDRSAFKSGLTQAETSLTRLKAAAPDLKTAKYDAELAKYKGMIESADNEKAAASDQSAKSDGIAQLDASMAELDKARTVKTYQPAALLLKVERELTAFKRSFPDHDVTAYEKKVSDFEAWIEKSYSDQDQAAKDSQNFRQEYDETFSGLYEGYWAMGKGEAGDIAAAQEKLNKFTSNINVFVNSELGKKAPTIQTENVKTYVLNPIETKVAENNKNVDQWKTWVQTGHKKWEVFQNYFKILAAEEYWRGNAALYPANGGIQAAFSKTKEVHNELGTIQNVEAMCEKNYAKYLTTVTLEPAAVKDAALEADMKAQFLTMDYGKGLNVIKVNIKSSNWTINRHAISGVILNRIRDAHVVTKDSNGNCWIWQFGIMQMYDGSNYGNSEGRYLSPDKKQILCENVH